MKWKGIFVRRSSSNHRSGLQEAPQFATPWASSCPAATRYGLTPQQSIPTTACLAVVRESQCGQVWQFLGAYNRSSHVGCLAVAGSLTYHTVWSQSGRSSTRVVPIARASMSVLPGARARLTSSLACAPVTPLCCGLFFLALYDASCSVGLLHNTHALAPTQPISFATAAPQATALPSSPWKSRARLFFNFYASSLPKLRTLFALFCLGSRLQFE